MQHHGALAYQNTAKAVESPRDREAALLIKAAAGLQIVKEDWPVEHSRLNHALTFNRKLWTIFMASVTRDDSQLGKDVRQNITNLGLYILNETREILLDPVAPARLDTLININRQLSAGLRGS